MNKVRYKITAWTYVKGLYALTNIYAIVNYKTKVWIQIRVSKFFSDALS